jgi:hypothetical protein
MIKINKTDVRLTKIHGAKLTGSSIEKRIIS